MLFLIATRKNGRWWIGFENYSYHLATNSHSDTCSINQWTNIEGFEDTKGAIRIRISKKNRQHIVQKKKYKRINNNLQNIHIKLKIE